MSLVMVITVGLGFVIVMMGVRFAMSVDVLAGKISIVFGLYLRSAAEAEAALDDADVASAIYQIKRETNLLIEPKKCMRNKKQAK